MLGYVQPTWHPQLFKERLSGGTSKPPLKHTISMLSFIYTSKEKVQLLAGEER